MTAQLPSRERLELLANPKLECTTFSKQERAALARFALAAHEQEPVAYMYRDNLHTDARFSLEPRIRNWSQEDISEYEISETPLYAHPAPVPAVPDEMTYDDARNFVLINGMATEDRATLAMRVWNACRAAIQPNVTLTYEGDNHTEHNLGMVNHIGEDTGTDEVKPVTAATVPAGYVLVPVEPTQEMIDAHVEGVQSGGMRKGYRAMLASAPAVSDGWIPVSERMPEPGRWLALYGAPVYTHGPDAGKPWYKFSVGEGYLDKEDGKFYLLNWESPGQIGDNYNNLLAIATHWMYWELPDAPKVTP